MKYKVIRVEGKPSDPGGMVFTMRRRRKLPVMPVFLASVVLFFLAMCLPTFEAETTTGEEVAGKEMSVATVHDVVDSVDSFETDTEDPLEDEKIEAALVEQGYFRDDVPLTYIEQDYLHTACEEFGVDYHLMLGLIERETNFRNIPGDGGSAYGYCQIWPKWWRDLMGEIRAEDLMDPYDNFRTGCAIVAYLIERFGTVEDALTYYNTGRPGESAYSRAVLKNAEKWSEQIGG